MTVRIARPRGRERSFQRKPEMTIIFSYNVGISNFDNCFLQILKIRKNKNKTNHLFGGRSGKTPYFWYLLSTDYRSWAGYIVIVLLKHGNEKRRRKTNIYIIKHICVKYAYTHSHTVTFLSFSVRNSLISFFSPHHNQLLKNNR